MIDYVYAGLSNIGLHSKKNEDYIQIAPIDKAGNIIFAITADGTSSECETRITPAAMVCEETIRVLRRTYSVKPEWFLNCPEFFLSEAFHTVNRILGSMQIANESAYASSGVSATGCLLYGDGQIALAHIGNSRLYRIRPLDDHMDFRQLTVDHTEAQAKVNRGIIQRNQYYISPDRFILTRGIGILAEPLFDTTGGRLKPGDIILLSTDGVHYALRPDDICEIISKTGTPDEAVKGLLDAVKITKYPDDASAVIIYLAEKV